LAIPHGVKERSGSYEGPRTGNQWSDGITITDTMNRNRLLPLAILLAAAGIVALTIICTRTAYETCRTPGRPVPVLQTRVVDGVPTAATNQPGQTGNAVIPAEKLPVGWQDFRTITEQERLDRVTAAMENHTLPADVLAFFEKELFNRQHWDVTRNNMAKRSKEE
jgi:hypothetical protein